ncbi:MAG: hypothetical protein RL748_4121 [Pseudomonadota bacterium]|jgi:hypothetical protein
MRSTRASSAVARLKTRSGNSRYSMQIASNGTFALMEANEQGVLETRSPQLELDEFVAFVNATLPEKPKRVSKLDTAFELQLRRKSPG